MYYNEYKKFKIEKRYKLIYNKQILLFNAFMRERHTS